MGKTDRTMSDVERLIGLLPAEPLESLVAVTRCCATVESLAAMGAAADAAMPALLRILTIPVSLDCAIAVRVAAAEAVWKVGQRHDLALPILAWALKDEQWGMSEKAAKLLGEMGGIAHGTTPDLIGLADRRIAHGPFFFETFTDREDSLSLLAVVARALGHCGYGVTYGKQTREMLTRLARSQDQDARTAAVHELQQFGAMCAD